MKFLRIYLSLLIATSVFLTRVPKPVIAAGVLFHDNFDQNSLTNWHLAHNQQASMLSQPCLYQNQTANWQVHQGQLGMMIEGPACSTVLVPNFLDLTDIKNYQVDFDMTMNESYLMDRSLLFSWQDDKNYYTFDLNGAAVIARKVVNGRQTILENSLRYQFWPNQTYHITIIFKTFQEIILKINAETIVDFIDIKETYPGFRTVGLAAGVSNWPRSTTSFDNFVVTSLDPGITLPLTGVKQTDPKWAGLDYDSAHSWSTKPTIARWGCALSSMVMIMRYYQMLFLPNGLYVTPASLNDWLKSQADGYIGDGNLNWIAVTRLNREISAKYFTPKLEFRRFLYDPEIAKAEIRQQRPVIFNVPNHFFVGYGVTSDEQDFLISDPAYSYTRLSQHTVTPFAIDTFVPSYTDLSYLLVVHHPNLQVNLINPDGQVNAEFDDFAHFPSFLQADDDPTASSAAVIEQSLAKPPIGNYLLEVTAQQPVAEKLQILSYTQDGTPSDLSQFNYFSEIPKYFFLQITASNSGEVVTQLHGLADFHTFQKDVEIGHTLQQFYTESSWQTLDTLSGFGEISSLHRQLRYFDQLKQHLITEASEMSSQISQILQTDLISLGQQLNGIISR